MGYFYIFLTTIFFSTMEIALKLTAGSFHPIQITFSRFLVAALLLMPFALTRIKSMQIRLTWRDMAHFAGLGFICVVLGMICYQFALLHTKASVVAVLFSCNPIFVLLFAHYFLHEHIRKRNIASLLFQVAGIFFIVDPLHMELSIVGVIFTLLSAAAFALYGVLGRCQVTALSGTIVTSFSFLFGSLELMLLSFLTRIPVVAEWLTGHGLSAFANVPIWHGHTPQNFWLFVYVSLVVTGGGYYYYFKSMEKTSAATASLVFYFKPVVAPILAMLILKEHIPFNMVAGIVCVLFGSSISLIPLLYREYHLRKTMHKTKEISSKN